MVTSGFRDIRFEQSLRLVSELMARCPGKAVLSAAGGSRAITYRAAKIVDQAQALKRKTARGENRILRRTSLNDGLIHALCMLPT